MMQSPRLLSKQWRQRLHIWLAQDALPLWRAQGIDHETGLFRESLDAKGRDAKEGWIRARVQPRQLYLFSQAQKAGFDVPQPMLESGFQALQTYHKHKDGGYITLLNRDGSVRDATRELYDQAFILLAMAGLYDASKNPMLMELARKLTIFLDENMSHPQGGYIEFLASPDNFDVSNAARARRQNPHMHLLEAFMALYRVSGDPFFFERATQMIGLFETFFLNAQTGQVNEFFTSDWTPLSDAEGQVYDPGHGFEWVYLLDDFETLGGKLSCDSSLIMDWSLRYGLDDNKLFALDTVRVDAPSKTFKNSASRRLWVQTELLRAYYVKGDVSAVEKLLAALFETYLATTMPGLWSDAYKLQNNQPVMSAQNVPSSTLYHLWNAFSLLANLEK